MAARGTDYEHMGIGRLEHLAAQGDPGAQDALKGFAQEVRPLFEQLASWQDPIARMGAEEKRRQRDMRRTLDQIGREKDAKEKAAAQRERQMVQEIVAMRELAERAEKRARAAERRSQRMFWLAAASMVVTLVSAPRWPLF